MAQRNYVATDPLPTLPAEQTKYYKDLEKEYGPALNVSDPQLAQQLEDFCDVLSDLDRLDSLQYANTLLSAAKSTPAMNSFNNDLQPGVPNRSTTFGGVALDAQLEHLAVATMTQAIATNHDDFGLSGHANTVCIGFLFVFVKD